MTAGFPLDSGGLFKFGSFENRKGAAKPRPLCTPLGLFLIVQGIRCSYLLTCVCMLRYSTHYAMPILFHFFTFSVIHFWQGVCILRYSAHYAMPILFHFFTFSVIHFWQGPCILRYSAHYAMPIPFHFFTFSVIHFRQGPCILRYSTRYAMRSLALNLRRGEAGCWW